MITLNISVNAIGEIISTGDWDGETGGSSIWGGGNSGITSYICEADGTDNLSWGWGEGWEKMVNTDASTFRWSLRVYAYAEAQVITWSGIEATAYARADAFVEGPLGTGFPAQNFEVHVQESGTFGELTPDADGSPYSLYYVSPTASYLEANSECNGEHLVIVAANVVSGDNDYATAHGDAQAWVDLWYSTYGL
jgi:hypothetical protein